MPSPFPGMNPYLENPSIWTEVHKWLILLIAETLNPQLRPKYRAAIEERVYTSSSGDDALLVGIPDNIVTRSRSENPSRSPANIAIASPVVQPVTVSLPMPEAVKEWYLEVRTTTTGEVVTAIEVLSPKNKRRGEGRNAYLLKRDRTLITLTNWVEIDLLCQGQPMPFDLTADSPSIQSDYRILVSRSNCRPQADLFLFNLQDPIPDFILPLRSGDAEPIVNLQTLIHLLYDRGSYDLAIDYSAEPIRHLSEPDRMMLDTLLRRLKLRN
jgi:Protein of unknown function (DUF4058)